MESLEHIVPPFEGRTKHGPSPKAVAKMLELALAPAPKPAPRPVKKFS